MHLLQSGVPLVMVKDFLGHVDMKSTDVYVQADLEMKCKALELTNGPRGYALIGTSTPVGSHRVDRVSVRHYVASGIGS
jgi:hypothetical protein